MLPGNLVSTSLTVADVFTGVLVLALAPALGLAGHVADCLHLLHPAHPGVVGLHETVSVCEKIIY